MSGKLVDLTGQTFGRLTVIKRHPVDYVRRNKDEKLYGQSRWVVRCVCGRYKVVRGDYLRYNVTQSCGCRQKEIATKHIQKIAPENTIDLAGDTFGNWLVLEKTDQRSSSGQVMWKCQCLKCGRTKTVIGDNLRGGGSTQCRSCATKNSFTTHGLSYTVEYNRTRTTKRREKKRLLDSKWSTDMETFLTKKQPFCVVCSQRATATDHVLPLSKGYGLKPGNAVRLCKSCNSSKRDKLLEDLPIDWQIKIRYAALRFKRQWESHIPSIDFA